MLSYTVEHSSNQPGELEKSDHNCDWLCFCGQFFSNKSQMHFGTNLRAFVGEETTKTD